MRWAVGAMAVGLLGLAVAEVARRGAAGPIHPLTALSASEIQRASNLALADGRSHGAMEFTFIALMEPSKAEVAANAIGLSRIAEVGGFVRSTNELVEARVDLTANKVLTWSVIPGAQPSNLHRDYEVARSIVINDARWRDALRKRGLTRPEDWKVNVHTVSAFDQNEDGQRRVVVLPAVAKPEISGISGTVRGVAAYVNLTTGTISRFVDQDLPLPARDMEFRQFREEASRLAGAFQRWAGASPEIEIEVYDGEVRWGPWRFRPSIHPREGLVIHQVRYMAEGRERGILYKASLSEIGVPYGDPEEGWYTRTVLDAADAGMAAHGRSSLIPGVDAPQDGRYFDAVVNGQDGRPVEFKRAYVLYERVSGPLWRHQTAGVPSRELVLLTFATIDNYDYGIRWIFKQDGSMEVEALLTGVMSLKGADEGPSGYPEGAICGTRVSKGRVAPNHQHFFNFRLDFDIEGAESDQVWEIEARRLEDEQRNPFASAIETSSRHLKTEMDARRTVSIETSRKWKIADALSRNELGQLNGYVLVPKGNALPVAKEDSPVLRRAGFISHHLWVTPFDAAQRYAAGDYPYTGRGNGLNVWTEANRSIDTTDLVVWYTLGVTHLPRAEEWPVMPVERASFLLAPSGFFDRNPTLKSGSF